MKEIFVHDWGEMCMVEEPELYESWEKVCPKCKGSGFELVETNDGEKCTQDPCPACKSSGNPGYIGGMSRTKK